MIPKKTTTLNKKAYERFSATRYYFYKFMKLTGCTIIYNGCGEPNYTETANQQSLLYWIIGDLSCVACGFEDAYTNEKAIKSLSAELFGKLIEACAEMGLNEITMQLLHLRQNVNGIESHLNNWI